MTLQELMCNEEMLDMTEQNLDINIYLGVTSVLDRVILDDNRVMANMLAEEKDSHKVENNQIIHLLMFSIFLCCEVYLSCLLKLFKLPKVLK